MIPYWLLFAYFALGALQEGPKRHAERPTSLFLIFGVVIIGLLAGLRYEVGGDWATYEFMFAYLRRVDLGRALEVGDPAYQFLNWSVQQIGSELWLVNLVCAAIFAWGLYRLASLQSNPWLTVVVAVPYMIIVVAMGYTRQATALGIVMAGLAAMQRGASLVRFAIYVAAAALFHKTAVVVFPLAALASTRNRASNILVGLATSFMFYDMFIGEAMEGFVENYIEREYSSQGAAIRVIMTVIPAFLFLVFRRRLQFPTQEDLIWRSFSFATFGLLVLLIVLPSSTAVDRLAIYVMPLQLAVLARIPGTLLSHGGGKLIIIIYSAAIQFVWLNFAVHAQWWVPYRFYPL